MSDKKSVLLGILITSIIVLSVVSVSAGWFSDLFGGDDLEGELPTEKPAEVFVNVTPSANPRVVFRVFPPHDPVTAGYVDLNYATAGGDGLTTVNFSFLVTQDNYGNADLPYGDVTTYVRGNFTLDPTTYRLINSGANSCRYVGEGQDASTTFWYFNYSCTVTARHYDFPTNWSIIIQFDNDDAPGTWSVENRSTDFYYNPTYMINMTPAYINFTSLTALATNTLAERSVEIYNYGNRNITLGSTHQLRMNATTLFNASELSGTSLTYSIGASNFTGNALGSAAADACSSTNFSDGQFTLLDVRVPADTVTGGANRNDSFFCATNVPNVPSGYYNAEPFNWTIENYGT
jgi:hypothetical protein